MRSGRSDKDDEIRAKADAVEMVYEKRAEDETVESDQSPQRKSERVRLANALRRGRSKEGREGRGAKTGDVGFAVDEFRAQLDQ